MEEKIKIKPKEALCHLVLSRENKGHIDFEKKYKECLSKDWNLLKNMANLPDERFFQCFESQETEIFFDDIPVYKLYNKYFHKKHDPWDCDYLINFAEKHFNNENILNFSAEYQNPKIIVIKLKNEYKYNILDGMKRSIFFIKKQKLSIPAVVISVKKELNGVK